MSTATISNRIYFALGSLGDGYEARQTQRLVTMTTERYHDLRTECSSGGVTLDSCCFQSCFRDIAKSQEAILYGEWLPSDIPIDKAAMLEEWEGMGSLQRTIFQLDMIKRGQISALQA